ncbi:MAG TPA: TAT-variant-translocated molybdopterin oxidoreductase [Candidatus Cryosericum sp.]|nr:TAT-variant-translocated molybdopterin oxidoreductase [Candidatus Cryosericum sp.]
MSDEPRDESSSARPHGRQFWRSLAELEGSPGVEEGRGDEFPPQASEWPDGLDRRRFLQLAGASLALAGLQGCTRQPVESIVPYVRQPEEIVPGRPLFYATVMTLGGYGHGLLVESHEGRPTKIEGNPSHPASLGSTDAYAQAAILGLYDPDRSQLLTELRGVRIWKDFVAVLQARLKAQEALDGEGIRILTETVTSPTLVDQIRAVLDRFPKARWHQWEPVTRDAVRLASRAAFGRILETRYDLRSADVIVALDADFVTAGPGAVRRARDFADRRRVRGDGSGMCRLYAIESAPTAAGTLADHRLAVRAGAVPIVAAALARELGVPGATGAALALEGSQARFVRAVAADLLARPGRCVVIPGEYAPAAVHVLAHAINHRLDASGATVVQTEPVEPEPIDQASSLRELVEALRAGRVDLLAIVGGNPVHTAPADLRFAEAMLRAPFRFHLATEEDETSDYCQWHVPEAHFLEAWSDARAFDGTASIAQPLIEPLYGGRSAHEVLAVFLEETPRPGLAIVQESWRSRLPAAGFEASWRRSLHDGVIEGTALPALTPAHRADSVREAVGSIRPPGEEAIELVLRPDPSVFDGRFANNGWLQELPRPLSKLTWDNVAYVSPAMARRLGVASGDVVEVQASGAAARLPVWVLPGHPDGSVTAHLGYGRRRIGRVGTGVGVDLYPLRDAVSPWLVEAAVTRTGERTDLASTQEHFLMEGRHPVRRGTLAELRANPGFVAEMEERPAREESFYPPHSYPGRAWGLAVDLSVCTGCNACVIACQAENNIPVVGKDQVRRGREMHWLRIDRYYEGPEEDPAVHNMPVMCMHCEQAPCEVVCPVGATNHSSEGLNDMVYNRCVGTRYCSNNCPYKVRRFNFLQYSDERTPVLKLGRNPDVTVRSRGVMEKCTYCVQRINGARIEAEKEGRPVRDGEVTTACQQACPTQAIVFGDINDRQSRVALWRSEPTHYGLLEELNTRPRTTYLAKLSNPSDDLERG